MNKSDKAAVLALVREIADQALTKGLKPGKEKGKYERLIKLVDRDLKRILPLDQFVEDEVRRKIVQFGEQSKWEGRGKTAGTVLSFLLAVVEDHTEVFNPRIGEVLAELVEYYEHSGQIPAACCWAGDLAAQRLKGVLG